jgi:hypothetical protein
MTVGSVNGRWRWVLILGPIRVEPRVASRPLRDERFFNCLHKVALVLCNFDVAMGLNKYLQKILTIFIRKDE